MLHHEELTGGILGAAFEVHSRLGPGLLESAYQACLGLELLQRRIPFEEDSVPLSPPWCSVLTVVKKLLRTVTERDCSAGCTHTKV